MNYPFLSIPIEKFDRQNPDSSLSDENFIIPKKVFPPSFFVKDDRFLLGGYFVGYEDIKLSKLISLCLNGEWKKIASLNAEFLIFRWDKISRELCVLTDACGKFPCYFCVSNDSFLASCDLSTLIKKINKRALNLNTALDYISTGLFLYIYDETLIKEISQIPPATLLRVTDPPEFTLEPLVNLKSFTLLKPNPFSSNAEFAGGLKKVVKKAIGKRLKALGGLKFGAELSSGLDSGLVCYFLKKLSESCDFDCYTSFTGNVKTDTDIKLARKFSKRHGISVFFDRIDDYFPFNKSQYLGLFERYPPTLTGIELAYESFKYARNRRILAYFQGLGGDELFEAHTLDFWLPFRIQEFYFMTAWRFKLGIENILTIDGLRYLINEDRFVKRRVYPSIYGASAINANLNFFSVGWETEVWPMTPFVDPEVIQYSRLRIPRNGLVAPGKREILSSLEEIFIKEQFGKKIGDEKLFNQFFIKKREFIIDLLKNSVLSKTGWFKTEEIISNFEKGNIGHYLEYDTSFYLEYWIRLEDFLQNNDIKID